MKKQNDSKTKKMSASLLGILELEQLDFTIQEIADLERKKYSGVKSALDRARNYYHCHTSRGLVTLALFSGQITIKRLREVAQKLGLHTEG